MYGLAEAGGFVKQARANGSISSVMGTAALEAEWARKRTPPPPPPSPAPRAPLRSVEAKLRRMEAEDERRWQQAHPPKPAFDPAKWKQQDYAESARWERQQAYLRYRQGEWADPQPPKSLWQRGWDSLKNVALNAWTATTKELSQTKQSLDDLWHKRSVRIRLAAAVVAVTMPTLFASVNLATYHTFHVPAITWFGIGGENKGVETALANQTAIRDVVHNYNTLVASGATFACEYNQKGKPRKECARSVEIQPILVEAAISVQSQWKIPWLDSSLARWIQGQDHSSEGIAQVSQPELDQWADNLKKYLPLGASLSPQDAHASAGAVIERIAPVLEYCQQQNCDANSQVIVAAMAQNGKGFTVETLENIFNPANAEEEKYLRADGSINWERYFEKQGPRPLKGNLSTILSRLMQNVRAVPGNFERQFMLQLYVNDLKLLQAKGETLPEGVDLEYLECLADRLPGASYHCETGKDN